MTLTQMSSLWNLTIKQNFIVFNAFSQSELATALGAPKEVVIIIITTLPMPFFWMGKLRLRTLTLHLRSLVSQPMGITFTTPQWKFAR